MLQTGTVEESTLELLKSLQAESLLAGTRLVGGTALSLQIAHRVSDDLDLFSTEPIDCMRIQSLLIEKYGLCHRLLKTNSFNSKLSTDSKL